MEPILLDKLLSRFHSLDPCSRWEEPSSQDGELWVQMFVNLQLRALENGGDSIEVAKKYSKVSAEKL